MMAYTLKFIDYARHLPDENNFNAYYNIVNLSGVQTMEIQWNRESKEGKVKKLNESVWNCWDAKLQNASCP